MMTLKEYLDDHGMTVYELAKLVGVTTGAIYKIEDKPLNTIRLSTAHRIAKALGITMDDFIKDFTDPILDIDDEMEDGWYEVGNISIYIEGNKVLRGMTDGWQATTVYPYVMANGGGLDKIEDLTIKEMKKLSKNGKLFWR